MNKKLILVLMIPLLFSSIFVFNMKALSATPTVNIGVLAPFYLTEGGGGTNGKGGMIDGAELAAQQINAAGGINVGGTKELINLDVQDEGAYDLSTGTYNTVTTDKSMTEMLGKDQFIVGGFREETTSEALSDLALWNGITSNTPVPFFICGAPDNLLIGPTPSINDGESQWVFRDTPVNDTMLFYTVAAYIKDGLAPLLASIYCNSTYPVANPGQFRYAVIAEDLTWTSPLLYALTAPPETGAVKTLPATLGYSYYLGPNVTTNGVTGTMFPGYNAVTPATTYDFTALVANLKSEDVHLIIDAFSLPEVNDLISAVNKAGMPAIIVGIDVYGQQQSHWADTGGSATTVAACDDEVDMCYSGTATPIVPGVSVNLWNDFVNFTGGYWPMYTAEGAYDALYGLKLALESAGTADAKNPALLTAIEATNWTTASGQFMYYLNDIYCNSADVTWPPLAGQAYGYVRADMIQWVQNTTVPASPAPDVGGQMNVVSPTKLVNSTGSYYLPYAEKTEIPPTMYSLAAQDIGLYGKVGLQDLVILAKAYGSKPGDSNWNPNADIKGDGKVDLPDLVALAKVYGQSAPQWPLP